MLNLTVESVQKISLIMKIVLHRKVLTNGPKGAIIIKLSTREHERTEESAGNLGIRERARNSSEERKSDIIKSTAQERSSIKKN